MPTNPLSTTQINTFTETGAPVTVTVGTSGYYDITVDGAQGGASVLGGGKGGLGALASGAVYLQAGATIEIVVGAEGASSPDRDGGGGGGGSFVIETGSTTSGPLATPIYEVIGGGGGGASSLGSGGGGRTQGTGGKGGLFGTPGAGGTPANGAPAAGQGGNFVSGEGSGGGGGGLTGGAGGSPGTAGRVTGATFDGGSGSNVGGFGGSGGNGGFGGGGGGGGGGYGGGGGGGGYGGGGGGGGSGGNGGGGGSLVNLTNAGESTVDVQKTAATNSGNGHVTITLGIAPTITGGGSTTYANAGSTTDTPFAGVTVTDLNPNAPTDTLTITLSDINASLAYNGQALTATSPGSYTLTGSAANITSELDALTLNAPSSLAPRSLNGVEALNFSLSDSSNAYLVGPATASATADILASNFTKTFGYNGKIETFTAQASGYYDITADGAQGGAGNNPLVIGGESEAGGLGAMASGDVYLQAGATLEIVVGGAGESVGVTGEGGGGGGGSFVIETNNGSSAVDVNEVIAGGGGGGGAGTGAGGGANPLGGAGLAKPTGASGGGATGGAGGANGAAGQGAPASPANDQLGAGGGGFTGGAGGSPGKAGSVTGATFAGGRAGGNDPGMGGFGGGGGGYLGGGGGGGYGGGGGGGGSGGGGGGGSYVNPDTGADPTGNPTTTGDQISGDGSVTIAFDGTPCYCRGSLILTDKGDVAVETLSIGDFVMTVSGAAQPIKWIGMRSYDGRFVANNREVLPICIRAGALDENIPGRDLWVSPHHALYLEGVLIEAKDLVNGVSIVQAEKIERVDYFHVELFGHDVIFAEGAPAESFIDDDSRTMFQNVADYFALYPQAAGKRSRPPSFAPRLDAGFEVEAARQRIAARAGVGTKPKEPGALYGWVEGVTSDALWGWVRDEADPQTPVCLHVLADGCVIGRVLANRFRADLKDAGLGSGRHAFQFQAPKGVDFSKARMELRRATDGATLPCPAQRAA